MIKTVKGKITQKINAMENAYELPKDIHQRAYNKLRMLDNAVSLDDLRIPPSNRLEKLKGNRAERDSIRINDQWRICFRWEEGDAYEVEIIDYH